MAGLVSLTKLDPAALQAKQDKLYDIFRSLGRVLVAYSGGTDSAYLAWAARQALGDQAIAITADSPSIPRSHMQDAIEFAKRYGIRHEIIETREFDNPDYSANNPDRCFHCKDELFRAMEQIAPRFQGQAIVYGVNADDLGDYRPGQKAAGIHAVKAPLVEAGMTKAEIRELSRIAGLPTWDRPAAACLSSRVPYGTNVTVDTIRMIELAEEELRALGYRQFRVRYHDKLARVEIERSELPSVLAEDKLAEISAAVKRAGFTWVALDCDGYRQGAMNEVLKK
jgi:uncharacterized protein